MFMRIVLFRFAAVALVGLGVAVSTAFHQPATQQAVAAPAPVSAPRATGLSMVTLPMISVRANAVDATKVKHQATLAATSARTQYTVQVSRSSDERQGGSSAPTLRLDMPYYSFGKVVSRLSKD